MTGVYIRAMGEGHCECPGGPVCRCGWEQSVTSYRWYVSGPLGVQEGETETVQDARVAADEALRALRP